MKKGLVMEGGALPAVFWMSSWKTEYLLTEQWECLRGRPLAVILSQNRLGEHTDTTKNTVRIKDITAFHRL